MYKKASKLKLRFSTNKGNLSTEDLWDLSLEQLDAIAVKLDEQIEKSPRKSFIKTVSKGNEILELKFAIVKDIIDTKMAEQAARENQQAKSAQRQKLLELIAEKEDFELKGKSAEELRKMLNELD